MFASQMQHFGAADFCNFCKWYVELQHKLDVKDNDWIIWVLEGGEFDKKLGYDLKYKVYVQDRTRNVGYHAYWRACGRHGWDAWIVMQEVMLEELKSWEVTDKWLDRNRGRV